MTALLVLTVVCLAVCVRSVWGFGDAMLALPLLSLLIGIEQAAPLMAMLSALIAVWLLRESPVKIERRSLARLLGGALLGVPVGLWLLVGLPAGWAHALLGTLMVGFAGLRLRQGSRGEVQRAPRSSWWLDLGFGLLAGASSAAFDIAGPPLLIYATLRGWSGDELRVNLQALFLPLSVLTLGGHALAGLWTQEVMVYTALALPVVALTLIAGPRLRATIATVGGERILYGLILVLGACEIGRALAG